MALRLFERRVCTSSKLDVGRRAGARRRADERAGRVCVSTY